MKIVHVVYSLNPGGIESFLLQLTKRLPEKEIETHIFSFHSGTLQPQFAQIAKLHFFGTIWSPVTWIEIFKEFKAPCTGKYSLPRWGCVCLDNHLVSCFAYPMFFLYS